MKDTVTLAEVIAFLNELIALDAEAIGELIETRVVCNQALADHMTVQVMGWGSFYRVGVLGLLNGLFGVDATGQGQIASRWADGVVTEVCLRSEIGDAAQAAYSVNAEGQRVLRGGKQ